MSRPVVNKPIDTISGRRGLPPKASEYWRSIYPGLRVGWLRRPQDTTGRWIAKLALPGNIDIRGVQALLKDPGDFGLYNQMKTATYRDLMEAGVVIAGSPATVRDQLIEFCRDYGIGNLHAMLGFGSLPRHLVMKNIQLFSEEVLPHLRGLWTETEHQHHWWPERLGGSPSSPQLPTNSGLVAAR